MNKLSSRDSILSKIKQTREMRDAQLPAIPDMNSSVFKAIEENALSCFKKELEAVSGKCTLYNSESELAVLLKTYLQNTPIERFFCRDSSIQGFLSKANIPFSSLPEDFSSMQAGITNCEFLVARTGSIVVSSQGESGRQMQVFPPIHIILAKKEQLVDYPADGLDAIRAKYADSSLPSLISFVSGPSRTADIEKTLVLGAHGPKEVHVFIQV